MVLISHIIFVVERWYSFFNINFLDIKLSTTYDIYILNLDHWVVDEQAQKPYPGESISYLEVGWYKRMGVCYRLPQVVYTKLRELIISPGKDN